MELIGLIVAIIAVITAIIGLLIAHRDRLDKRYQKGKEDLKSLVLSERLDGIDTLENLARKNAKGYHIRITRLFCDFVRNPPKDKNVRGIREDVQAIMTALGGRNKKQRKIENQETSKEPILNLANANLSGMDLHDANLSGARLEDANLSGTGLEGVRGLTQAQLDQAVAYPDDLPDLTNAKDSETGEPLVWRGKAPPPSVYIIPKVDDTIPFFSQL